ncbi:MAG: hypothetical protein D4S02_15440 [Rhodocyclaceae bacterium]|nr:MAG: hypothetical protein D4S02_15440 [Rhodocyclaceae bacterium]
MYGTTYEERAQLAEAKVERLEEENEQLRDALRRASDEPNIDRARAIADAILTPKTMTVTQEMAKDAGCPDMVGMKVEF